MTSNLDIKAFLKSEKDARVKEREEEKEIRAKERQEDMLKISDLIKSGVKEEVMAAVQPIKERLDEQEKVAQELTMQLNNMFKEMDLLRETVNQYDEFPALSAAPGPGPDQQSERIIEGRRYLGGRQEISSTHSRIDGETELNRKVENMCASARRVIGFTPIEPRMLQLQIQSYGAKTMDEAMLMEIKSYLKCEMKVRPSDIDKLDIVKIFPPAKEDWNVLYVEFGSEYQVDKLFSYTKRMVGDNRIVRWYPKQMYDRYRAVESIAYHIRKSVKHKTRVSIGKDDIELCTREPTSNFWRIQPLPGNLPQFDLHHPNSFSAPSSSSPPPGRPGRTANIFPKVVQVSTSREEGQMTLNPVHLHHVQYNNPASSPSKTGTNSN